jgi:pimeloyl-ACP methyl ester carboxylesterase
VRQDEVMDEVSPRSSEKTPDERGPLSIWAHGAGSSAAFLARSFPSDQLGMADSVYLDDRSADVSTIEAALRQEAESTARPVVLGGVSLGAHAAARVLSDPPINVVGAMLCLPAWTGPAAYVAGLTATAADAVAQLGIAGILAELPEEDWVTQQLADAWAERTDAELGAELAHAAQQPGPSVEQLRSIGVPVGIVSMTGDPLHPASVSAQWSREIPRSAVRTIGRDDPGKGLAVLARSARIALRESYSS